MARAMGMSSREEYEEYDCPGAYRLPKRPEETWPDAWLGWDDWLGVPLALADASAAARRLGLRAEDEYLAHVRAHPGDRLPARPDRYYRERWGGWEVFRDVKEKAANYGGNGPPTFCRPAFWTDCAEPVRRAR